MKNLKTRVAALAAVTGLVATLSPLSAAFAATEPTPFPSASDGPIYFMSNSTGVQVPAGTQLNWAVSGGVVLSSIPVPAVPSDFDATRLPAPAAGETKAIGFIAPQGSEKTKAAWKAWNSTQSVPSNGVLLASLWPAYLSLGTPADVRNAGGNWSMGIAYLKAGDDQSVSKTYFTTINVDAGTGTWKFATPKPPTVNTDVATTTTLSADPTEVDAGSTTSLTATVSASKAVSGNVEFYKGNTKIGSQGLSGGTASVTATVPSVGANVYSAKFVKNTVSSGTDTTDTFLASTSDEVTVTGKTPEVALPPNAPTESALNVKTTNGAAASYDEATQQATLTVDAANNGKTVNAFVYSAPTYLGQLVVTGGKITVDVSTLAKGVHKLAIVDPDTGDVIAWASFDKTDAAIKPNFTKTITADVAAPTISDGEFSLTNLSGDTVTLTNPALVNGASVVSGELGNFKVTDLRQASTPGWTLKTDVTDFTKGSDTIAASALGIAPTVVSQAGSGATAPTLGAAQVSGSASYPWNFAELAASKFSGVSTYNADLVFTAPQGKPAGTYNSTLTLTLISN